MSIPNTAVQTANVVSSGDQSAFVSVSLQEALTGLKNGQITITVHNGEIVQIDKILRKRQFKSKSRS